MKNPVIFILLFLALMGSESCSTTRITHPEDLRENRVVISRGGGATGTWTTWYLLKNGDILQQDQLNGPCSKVSSITKGRAKSFFQNMDTLVEQTPPFSHPGNMTYILEYHDNLRTTVFKWGDPNFKVPESIATSYQDFMSLIK